MRDVKRDFLGAHKWKRKIELKRSEIKSMEALSAIYTPGVVDACLKIKENPESLYDYTSKGDLVAIVTDGSRILGLGNIGAYAGIPVMESKSLLYKTFGDVDAIPVSLATQNMDEIIHTVKTISPCFGGINLEDIESPKCLEIEEELSSSLDIPVFHDDQQGTAIAVLAGLINAVKVVNKDMDARILIAGCGAAGYGIARLLTWAGFRDIVVCEKEGALYEGCEWMNRFQSEVAKMTNRKKIRGKLKEVLVNRDIFIGVTGVGNLLSRDDIKTMNDDAIVFALSNPVPEILPDEAKKGDARIIATGRSDFPNQINNVIVFPGFFRYLLDNRIRNITPELQIKASRIIANAVDKPREDKIIPDIFAVGKRLAEMKD